ncbi:MAG TPA: SDR family oxidoreductase [Thermoanaerobaculia bacterium]|nr:SDR family oxidoreductase [Thermoanaerobaculia bacterium]
MLGRFGRLDALVNNAGIGIFKRLEDFSPEEFDATFRVNVRGAWTGDGRLPPPVKAAKGLVFMISSDVSTRTFLTGGPNSASKFALRALARTLQRENLELRATELRPGATDTSFAGSTPEPRARNGSSARRPWPRPSASPCACRRRSGWRSW